jgi:hypothetical protein
MLYMTHLPMDKTKFRPSGLQVDLKGFKGHQMSLFLLEMKQGNAVFRRG